MAKATIKDLEAKLAELVKENTKLQKDGEIAVTLINRQAQQIEEMQDNINVLNNSLRAQAKHQELQRDLLSTKNKQISALMSVEPFLLMLEGMIPTINLNVSAFENVRAIDLAAERLREANTAGNQDGCNTARRS